MNFYGKGKRRVEGVQSAGALAHAMGSAESRSTENGDLLRALTTADGRADLAVFRTRRRIHGALLDRQEQRTGMRKQTGLVLMVSFVLLALLVPAIWSSVEIFRAGGHFLDMQTQSYMLGLLIFPAIVAAATAGYVRHHARDGGREDRHEL